MDLHPVILAGGSGTRLWPMSRESHPKQFLPLLESGAKSLSPFQATLERVAALGAAQPASVVSSVEHRFLVADQARGCGHAIRATYLEPCARSTAPAIALVAFDLLREAPDALLLTLPADHDIPDAGAFAQAVRAGGPAARAGRLVVFGVEPRWAETGYGYIERGDALAAAPGCFEVSSFVEKPEREIAERLVSGGRHCWNSGMFLFAARTFVDELERLEPALAAACRAAAESCTAEGDCRRIDPGAFARIRSISVDHAVLERTALAAVVPAAFAWSDIGSWDALWERGARDGAGNECHGDVHLHGARDCYVRGSGRLVVGIDVDDLVIVDTPDALLVARRGETQRVREAVERLRHEGRPEHRTHRRVHRPWGCYEDIDAGDRFRVKRITVNPGGKLSLQWHHHRAEHWVVVSGTARVTRGDEVRLLRENQSIYIELGQLHRLENPGKVPLRLIEVQTGAYLGEDDIVRVEDAYHRAPEAAPQSNPIAHGG
jgi:mannose-1-phosphate guanylyltransferase / mannose-6-phosphate isomerase